VARRSPQEGPTGHLAGEVRLDTSDGGRATDQPGGGAREGELDRLRAEVSDLRSQLVQAQDQAARSQQDAAKARQTAAEQAAAAGAAAPRARHRLGWRGPVSILLIVLGCILAPVSVLAVWTSNQVSNTDRYVANVSPLIREPAVKGALTDTITTAVTNQIHVQSFAKQAAAELTKHGLTRLGALISNFSGSIASGVAGLIHTVVAKVVNSQAVATLWVNGNRFAHAELVKALSGQPGALSVSNGKVVIGLGPVIDKVKNRLAAHGLTLVQHLPTINPTFPLFSAKYLVKAQSAYRLLNTLKWVLPVLSIILLAAGVYVARRHRRALVGASLGLAGSMLVLGLGIAIARTLYLNKIPSSALPPDAAAVVFDTLVRFIKQGLRIVLVIGLLIAIGAFFTGPSVTAVRTREGFKSAFAWLRGKGQRVGVSTGPVGTWVYRYRTGLRVAAVAAAGLVFVFWTNPTGVVALVLAVILLLVLGLIELIGRPPMQPQLTGAASSAAQGKPGARGLSARAPGQPDQTRPGSRFVTSWTIQALPSGSLNEQYDP
jgi:hypothetical protein